MNRMQQNIASHFDKLRDVARVSVIYSRGAESRVVQAVGGESSVRVETSNGVSVKSKQRDWIIVAADLVLSDPIIPRVGDRIVFDESVYEVQKLAGTGCYHEMSGSGVLRIHTRLIEMES